MKTMINKQIENVKWFLELINQKLNEISEGDRRKWITETIHMLEFGEPKLQLRKSLPYDGVDPDVKFATWERGNNFEVCHTAVKDYFENLMLSVEQQLKIKEKWVPRNKLKRAFSFHNPPETVIRTKIDIPFMAGFESKTSKDTEGVEQTLYRVNRELFKEHSFQIFYRSNDDKESLILLLVNILGSVPIRSIHKCPECKKWYFHISKKKKTYCSNKCAARKTSRERRRRSKESDPDKYADELAGGAKRARKSYTQKVRAENPKAKIDRRPWKHKD
jgi:hypothetical protein